MAKNLVVGARVDLNQFANGLKKMQTLGKASAQNFAKGFKDVKPTISPAALNKLKSEGKKAGKIFGIGFSESTKSAFKGAFAALGATALISSAVTKIQQAFTATIDLAKNFEMAMADVKAITGVTDETLSKFGDSVRDLAITFGTDATDQLNTFKGILSKLGPDIAKSPEGLNKMTEAINVMAKAGGLTASVSMDVLANSMLQFGIDLSDPIKAAEEMAKMMNVLAAGAKEGASEIPQTGQAILGFGAAAQASNVSFEEANAAIQTLSKSAGLFGAEAGVSMRNILISFTKDNPKTTKALKKLGLNFADLGQTLTKQGLNAALIQLKEAMDKLPDKAAKNALAVQFFGKANLIAGISLLNNTKLTADFTKKLTGTNTAVEQASIIMETYAERMSSVSAWISDVGISIGTVFTDGFVLLLDSLEPVVQAVKDLLSALAPLGNAIKQYVIDMFTILYDALKPVYDIFVSLWPVIKLSLLPLLAPLAVAIGMILAPMLVMGKILRVLAPLITRLSESIQNYLAPILKNVNGFLTDFVGGIKHAAIALLQFFGIVSSGKVAPFSKTYKDLNKEIEKTPELTEEAGDGVEDLADDLEDLGGAAEKTTKTLGDIKKEMAELIIENKHMDVSTGELTKKYIDLRTELRDLAEKNKIAAEAMKEVNEEQNKFIANEKFIAFKKIVTETEAISNAFSYLYLITGKTDEAIKGIGKSIEGMPMPPLPEPPKVSDFEVYYDDMDELAQKAGTTAKQFSEDSVNAIALTTQALIEGQKNAGKAIIGFTIDTVSKSILLYIPQIMAAFVGQLGVFGIPAALLAIGVIQGLLATAKSAVGAKEGYTGDAPTNQPMGVFHGQEFVHTAEITKRSRPLFEHLSKGGTEHQYFVNNFGHLIREQGAIGETGRAKVGRKRSEIDISHKFSKVKVTSKEIAWAVEQSVSGGHSKW